MLFRKPLTPLVIFSLCLAFALGSAQVAHAVSDPGYYYAIITSSEFATAPGTTGIRDLRSFDADHQAIIISLDDMPADSPGNPRWDEIRDYILDTLLPAPPLGYGTKYILLVGDKETIPMVEPNPGYYQADMFYSARKVAIGRIPSDNNKDIYNY